jgi:hypothetical protein
MLAASKGTCSADTKSNCSPFTIGGSSTYG